MKNFLASLLPLLYTTGAFAGQMTPTLYHLEVIDPTIISKIRKSRNYPLLPGVSAQEGLLK